MEHGGDLGQAIRRCGGRREEWLDLSTGINPWPWPVAEIAPHSWQRLPARDSEAALIAAAREAYRIPREAGIVPAPGTQALINWLGFLAPPGAVAIVGPTYGEHARSWRLAGHPVAEIGALEDLPGDVTYAVLVNPNNPDGRLASAEGIARAAERIAGRNGWLVVDESFADLDPAMSVVDLCAALPVVVLRSFGKFYGLAGLRLGFAIAAPLIAETIAEALGPWAVSGPALALGAAALRDARWAGETRHRLAAEATKLDEVLENAGLALLGGTALYRLARHDNAQRVHDELARRHIWTRCFADNRAWLRFGLPPDSAARARLARALAEIG